MRIEVDPHRFTGKPLLATATARDDYSVTADGMRAGRIMRQPKAFGAQVWLWSVTGPGLIQAGVPSSGEADSLEGARQAFRAAFDRWLAWAKAHDGTVHWLD